MLYRVANLSKSSDKRLKWLSGFNRKRGTVGEIQPVTDYFSFSDYEGLFFLFEKSQDVGVYRKEELEVVTEKQLQLESLMAGLLTVFPNQNPLTVLDCSTTDSVDDMVVEILVPAIRKIFKKELSLEFLKSQGAY